MTYFTPLVEHLSSLNDTQATRDAFMPLFQDTAAELLCNAFLGLRTEDVQRIDMAGLYSGVWISTLLCWLNPGNIDIFNETQELIMGRGSGKIVIHLISPDRRAGNADAWEIQQWNAAKDIKALIHLEPQREYMRPNDGYGTDTLLNENEFLIRHDNRRVGIPRSMFYGYVKLTSGFSEETMHVIGQTAHGIFCVAIRELHLLISRGESEPHTKIPFSHICTWNLKLDPEAVLVSWGFPITAASSIPDQVQQFLMKGIGSVQHHSSVQLDSLYVGFDKFIGTLCRVTPFDPSFDSHLLSFALHMATTCVVEANHRAEFGFDRAFPSVNPNHLRGTRAIKPAPRKIHGVKISWLLDALWGDDRAFSLDTFMSMSYGDSEAGNYRRDSYPTSVLV